MVLRSRPKVSPFLLNRAPSEGVLVLEQLSSIRLPILLFRILRDKTNGIEAAFVHTKHGLLKSLQYLIQLYLPTLGP
jgi:hypothetical protein